MIRLLSHPRRPKKYDRRTDTLPRNSLLDLQIFVCLYLYLYAVCVCTCICMLRVFVFISVFVFCVCLYLYAVCVCICICMLYSFARLTPGAVTRRHLWWWPRPQLAPHSAHLIPPFSHYLSRLWLALPEHPSAHYVLYLVSIICGLQLYTPHSFSK